MTDPLLSLEGFTVIFDSAGGAAPAVAGIDLAVGRGETLGIVGESGSGKSVTWLAALGLLGAHARTGGRVRLDGRDVSRLDPAAAAAIRGRRIAMIFQDPMSALNPVLSIGRQIREVLALHRGLRGRAARDEACRLLDRVGIATPAARLGAYPHELSGGMCQRVMIAMALAGEPDLLIADEPTTALDATIQAQILDLLADLRDERGMSLVLISHDLGVVADLADRIAVMYCGRVVETAPTDALFQHQHHPYTAGLMAAVPRLHGPRRRLVAIPGQIPAAGAGGAGAARRGCVFAPRCAQADATAGCADSMPPLAPLAAETLATDTLATDTLATDRLHQVACFKATARPQIHRQPMLWEMAG